MITYKFEVELDLNIINPLKPSEILELAVGIDTAVRRERDAHGLTDSLCGPIEDTALIRVKIVEKETQHSTHTSA